MTPAPFCSACKSPLVTRREIERHNLACAENGERAYPRPTAPPLPSSLPLVSRLARFVALLK
jgi:hypothetical protein